MTVRVSFRGNDRVYPRADDFWVDRGCLILYAADGSWKEAISPGLWVTCEKEPDPKMIVRQEP